jgi:hypothetical protein
LRQQALKTVKFLFLRRPFLKMGVIAYWLKSAQPLKKVKIRADWGTLHFCAKSALAYLRVIAP